MDALIAKLSAEQIMNLAGGLIFAGFAAILGSVFFIRSAILGYAFYKYRAKKRLQPDRVVVNKPVASVEASREARPLSEPVPA